MSVPERPRSRSGPDPKRLDLRSIARNRPFVILLVSYTVSAIGSNLPATLILFYVQYVLRSDLAGTTVRPLDYTQPPMDAGAGAVLAGSTWNFQHWFRDPGGAGSGFNFSNALTAAFCP